MESPTSSIESQVSKIRELMFSNPDPYSCISPSAYDTAWLAMIPDPQKPSQPMFKTCLNWVIHNQKEEGFWGECDAHGMPTIECLPATLSCIVALKKWNVGTSCIEKASAFIQASAEKLLEEMNHYPRSFAIVFPAMVELADTVGVELVFQNRSNRVVSEFFKTRTQILEKKKLVDKCQDLPLLSYLEALPASYDIDQEDIINNLSSDGSLFQSPSATASAFMATGNEECMAYLLSVVKRCASGVPATYPMDEELIKLCMVNQIIRLGLAQHFVQEIEGLLTQVYWNYLNQESWPKPINSVAAQLFKDALAFQLLRMHGYNVSSDCFCWFLQHEDLRNPIENDQYYFTTAMLNVYRATNLMFSGEYDAQEARSFSKKLLDKAISVGTRDDTHSISSLLLGVIEHELSLPWFARLDHLEHRIWIEEKDSNVLWMGKASPLRLSRTHNGEIIRLAMQDYELRQSIYRNELEELKRWSKDWGLSNMGFGREKTTYCYFAIAASTCLPYDSDIRMMVAKSGIIITVADDFFDMEGSLIELKDLTIAVQRWNGQGLSGHGKVIFDVLDNFVREIAAKYLKREGSDITNDLHNLWFEIFASWFTESLWSKTRTIPSMNEYLETGMISIAAHALVLPAACYLNPSLPNSKLKPAQYGSMTRLLMVIARLLNDIQSYKKEKDGGKINSVLIYLQDNPDADIEDSIAFVRELIDKKKKQLLKEVLMDGSSYFSKPCKHLHLSCMKVFQMFFNSNNGFDSNTQILPAIGKAFYIPLEIGKSKPLKPLALHSGEKKTDLMTNCYFNKSFGTQQVSWPASRDYGHQRIFIPPKVKLCFP